MALFREVNEKFKKRQERDYNKRHRAHEIPALPDDSEVWVTSSNQPTQGRVITPADTPRSYLIQQHLNIVPNSTEVTLHDNIPVARSRIMTRSQTGTGIVAPKGYQT